MASLILKKMLGIHGKSKDNYNILADYEPVPNTSSAKVALFQRKDSPQQDLVCEVYDFGSEPPEETVVEKLQSVKKSVVSRVRQCFCSYNRLGKKSL